MTTRQEYFFPTTIERYMKKLSIPTHSQRKELYEIIFITDGFLIRGCNLQAIQVNPQELHVLLAGQITSFQSLSDDAKGFYCQFNDQFLYQLEFKDNLAQELAFINSFMLRYPLRFDAIVARRVSACFENILELHREAEIDFRLIRSYLLTIIYEVKKVLLESVADPYPSKPFQIAKQYNDLLVKHISQQHHIEFYAAQLDITPNHLNKSVKMTTGKTASAILNEVRIMEARIQLKHTMTPVGDIAFNLGYDDPSYFTKSFKKAIGIAPLEYRKQAD